MDKNNDIVGMINVEAAISSQEHEDVCEVVDENEAMGYEEILEADASVPLDDELQEIEESGVLEKFAQEEEAKGNVLLSDEETRKLFMRMNEHGRAAGDAIAEIYACNQGLVRSIVSRYRRKDSWLDFDGLVLEGNIGLLTAIRRYDADKGAKFSTFAYGTIRGRVLRAQEKDPRVVKPFSKLSKELLDLKEAFWEEHHREPIDDKELLDFAKDLKNEDGTSAWSAERLKLAALKLRQSLPASSLDEPLSSGAESEGEGGDEPTRGDFLSASPEKSADDEESERVRAEKIEEAIEEAELDEKTAALLKSFLRNPAGIYDDSEIAALLGQPTEAELSRLLRDGLKNRRLRKALKERGLIEAR